MVYLPMDLRGIWANFTSGEQESKRFVTASFARVRYSSLSCSFSISASELVASEAVLAGMNDFAAGLSDENGDDDDNAGVNNFAVALKGDEDVD